MSNKQKFEARLTFWTTPEVADAYERAAAGSMLSVSDFLRDATSSYAVARGLLPVQQPAQPAE
jgi:uncharacterized protein (DUF1778 family)